MDANVVARFANPLQHVCYARVSDGAGTCLHLIISREIGDAPRSRHEPLYQITQTHRASTKAGAASGSRAGRSDHGILSVGEERLSICREETCRRIIALLRPRVEDALEESHELLSRVSREP